MYKFVVPALLMSLLGVVACSPAVPGGETPPPSSATQAASAKFLWTARVANSGMTLKAAQPSYRPVRLESVNYVQAGAQRFERSQIQVRALVAPAVAEYQSKQRAASEELARQRAASITQNAENARKRSVAMQERIKAEREAAKQRFTSASPSPFKTQAEETVSITTTPAVDVDTEAVTNPNPYQLIYNSSNGQFSLESPSGEALPLVLKMDVQGLAEPITIPVVLTAASLPLTISASQNAQQQTQVSGSLGTSPRSLFQIMPDGEGDLISWTGADGQSNSFDLDEMQNWADQGMRFDDDTFAEINQQMGQMMADLEQAAWQDAFAGYGDDGSGSSSGEGSSDSWGDSGSFGDGGSDGF